MSMHGRKNMSHGGKPAENAGKTFKRLMSYLGRYRLLMIPVVICILVSAVAGVAGSLFLKTLIDDYITPLLISGENEYNRAIKDIQKIV